MSASATMSKASLILVLLTTILGLSANHVSSQQPPPIQEIFQVTACNVNVSDEYSAGSPYEANLRTVLATLQQQANSSKFYSTSSGAAPDTVYGQYYCRGDINTALCGACVKDAITIALTCNPSKGATAFISECTLRYSNKPVYAVSEISSPRYQVHSGNVSDPQQLSVALTALIGEAVNGGRPSLYATGNETMYGLVQCSPELSGVQCETCLQSIYTDYVPKCCGQWPAALFALYQSCQMMYSTEGLFYYDPPLAPPPLVTSPPSPPPASPVLMGSQPPAPLPFSAKSPINSSSEVVESCGNKKTGIAIVALVILLIFI